MCRGATGTFIAVGKGGEDARRPPGMHGTAVPVVIGTAAPGVVHHVRTQLRHGIGSGQVGGSQDPLGAFQQFGRQQITGDFVAALAGNPLGAGCHANLVGTAVIPDHGAHHVRPVTARVKRGIRVLLVWVKPVVVVIGGCAVPAAVVRHQCRVIPLGAGINFRHHRAGAVVTQCPDVIGVDQRDVPANGFGTGWGLQDLVEC